MNKIKEIKEDGIHLLVAKTDREDTMVCLYWQDFLKLLAEAKC